MILSLDFREYVGSQIAPYEEGRICTRIELNGMQTKEVSDEEV